MTAVGVGVMAWGSALGQAQPSFSGASAAILVLAGYIAVVAAATALVAARRAKRR